MLHAQARHFTGSWLLTWWMVGTVLLGITVACTILHQLVRLNSINVSSFLLLLLLAASSILLLVVVGPPHVIHVHHFLSAMVMRFQYLMYANVVIAMIASALSFRSVIKGLPNTRYPWDDGRLYAIDVDALPEHAKSSLKHLQPSSNKQTTQGNGAAVAGKNKRFPVLPATKTFHDMLGFENFKTQLLRAFREPTEQHKNGILLHGLPGGARP